ncbi:MAG: FliI/YscN family ATPase [Deltaproteobacteria bacterium]|nr:FliI/YscN family ATPase [Deltaproteobacteria bacterium]
MSNIWERAQGVLDRTSPIVARGLVTDVTGLIVEGSGPAVGVGTTCTIVQGSARVEAQVVGFKRDKVLLMPFDELYGIAPGASIISHGETSKVLVSQNLLGRVIDPMGVPLDNRPQITEGEEVPIYQRPPSPLKRDRINDTFDVGIRAVNSLLTIGRGQRMAVMAGSGVGKSTFLGMLARHSRSSVNVIALVGERGREVREFIERDLGPEGMARSVIVVATSDASALLRIRCAFVATAIAEYFRDQGHDVCFMLDSITRFCMAQREIGLAIGEPPSTNGYTPSVFALLPKLMERAGRKEGAGAITGFYTVLVEGDDMNEPIADAVRGILDGHIILSRALAGRGQYPAIDVLQSVSRVMSDIVPREKLLLAQEARKVLADYLEAEDLITIGAYKQGQNPKVDYAVAHIDDLLRFLKQRPEEGVGVDVSDATLASVFNKRVEVAEKVTAYRRPEAMY